MSIVNGRDDAGANGQNLQAYVEAAGYRLDRVAVEINGAIVPKATYGDRILADGDHVEIVQFMGGG